ncbi:hypothetical protein CJI97_005466 [Candidozyma auris]|nr:hypothetical protein CJI97_005466 [[Candida] auris]
MHSLVHWAGVAACVWVAGWLLVYWLTGSWLGYISINNGVSFNHVCLKSSRLKVYAASVRFRLWGNSKRMIITDLRVEILPNQDNGKTKRTTSQSKGSPLDSSEPISIFPRRFHWFFRFLLWHFPTVDVELKSSQLVLSRDLVELERAHLVLKKQTNAHRKKSLYLALDVACQNILSSPQSAASKVPPLSMGTINVQAKTTVSPSDGVVNDTIVQLFLDNSEVGAFQILRHLFQEDKEDAPSPATESKAISREQQLQKSVDKLTRIHQRISSTFKEVSFNISNSRILGIPCIPTSSTCDLEEYFSHVDPSLSFTISVKSLAVQASHLANTAAGFMALFNNKLDRPIHLTTSAVLLQMFFVTRKFDETTKSWHSDVDEFLNIPNLGFSLKTNFLDHLAKGYGFKDCTMELYSSVSNPVLDLSVSQIALLSYNRILAQKVMILRKLAKTQHQRTPSVGTPPGDDLDDQSRSNSDSSPETPVAHRFDTPYDSTKHPPTTLLDKAVSLLNEYYPQIGIKITVEQPQYVIRSDGEQVKLVDISYSLMYFHLLTTAKNDYDANCHVLHPCLKFSRKVDVPRADENPRISEEVIGCNNAELRFHVLKNLRLKVSGLVENTFVNLGKPDVLNGLNEIITSVTKITFLNLRNGSVNQFLNNRLVENFGSEPSKKSHRSKNDKRFTMSKFYRTLPSWFVSAKFEVNGLQAVLGSTSPLLPPELIAELSKKSTAFMTDSEQLIELKILHHHMEIINEDVSLMKNRHEYSSSESSETLALSTEGSLFWKVSAGLRGLSLHAKKKATRSSPLLTVNEFGASIAALRLDEGNEMIVDSKIDEIGGSVDRKKVFTILGSIHLILQTIVFPVKEIKAEIRKDLEQFQRHERRGSFVEEGGVVRFQFSLGKINYLAKLSDEFKLRLQAFGANFTSRNNVFDSNVNFIRLLADSPHHKNLWCRLACVDSITIKLNDPQEDENIMIYSSHVRFFQPNSFVVYKLFDNISIFMKIIKHLVKCLNSEKKSTVVFPTESPPLKVPNVRFCATNLTYLMEDDPFEVELGLQFQLGLVEQRKRMDMLSASEEKVKQMKLTEEEFDQALCRVRSTISDSWIRKVKAYKDSLTREIEENNRYIVGNELDIPESDNDRIVGYPFVPPLLKIVMSDLDILIKSPEFPISEISQYIHDVGQGVPKDTKYNLMLPTYIDMHVNELRMHLRDYPLPLLHLPRALDAKGRGRALMMKGHLVIGEALCLEKEHLRQMEVQLSDPSSDLNYDLHKYDHLTINKSLSSVKIYTDMDVQFDSNGPCRFVWGQAYQFGIQQVMLNFDSFSKPPVDPSNKLGFWDKLRMLLHGKFSIRAQGSTQVEVAFKGGRDPYDLFPQSAGFILSFKDEVIWRINHHDDSLRFFDISAKTVSWYVPNYLAAPLMSWTRDSSKSIFLPDFHQMINTVHGYYLLRTRSHPTSEDAENPNINIEEKMAIQLSGGIRYVVGFLLQRQSSDGGVTNDCVPHYDIVPFNPEYTSEDHDTYKYFRSIKLHMTMSLAAHTDDSYNTIHLSPGTFNIFFKWWSMFQGNMMLPIRKGIVFGEKKASPKFSQHLFSNKFLFNVRNLFISHIYRGDYFDQDEDYVECFGLRARVKDFTVDLHQEKEERISLHKSSGKEIKALKMIMKLGEVSLSEIDMRSMHAKIFKDVYHPGSKKHGHCKVKIFDNNRQWFDPRDFHEAFISKRVETFKLVEVHPMAYSERFSYIKDTTNISPGRKDGSDRTHDCKLNMQDIHSPQINVLKRRLADLESVSPRDRDSDIKRRISALKVFIRKVNEEKEHTSRRQSVQENVKKKEHFQNRFIVTSMLFKWNVKIRDIFIKYLLFAQMKAKSRKLLSYEFVSMLEKIVNNEDGRSDRFSIVSSSVGGESVRDRKLSQTSMGVGSSQERLDNFDAILRDVAGDEKIAEDYKIEVIGVQIQFHTEEVMDTVSILSAPLLESKILSVLPKSDNPLVINTTVPERRHGVLLHEASVSVLERKDVEHGHSILEANPYGSISNWPPWLGAETCKDSSLINKTFLPIERMSVMITYDKVMSVNEDKSEDEIEKNADNKTLEEQADSSQNKLRVDIPKVMITSTSKQYLALYATALNLFHYSDPLTSQLKEKLSKLNFQTEFEDYHAMHQRLVNLHCYSMTLGTLLRGYGYRHEYLENEELNQFLFLNSESDDTINEIMFTVEALLMRDAFNDSSRQTVADWIIGTDEIVLHMLQDDKQPILDLRIEGGTCKRVLMDDNSNDNRVQIKNIQGNNLVRGAPYKRFVEPVYPPDEDDLITVDWSMQKPIGGIKIIENFEIKSRPLKIRVDEVTGRQLMQFIFQTDKESEIEKSTLIKMNNDLKNKDDKDEKEDDEANKENNEDIDDDALSEQASLTSTTAISEKDTRLAVSRTKTKTVKKKSSMKESSFSSGDMGDFEEDVGKMIERSKKYFSVTNMNFQPFEVMISLKLKRGFRRLLNVTDFTLQLPGFHVEKELLSMLDVVEMMKSMLIKSLFSHSGQLLKNMMKTSRHNRKKDRYLRKEAERIQTQTKDGTHVSGYQIQDNSGSDIPYKTTEELVQGQVRA